CGPPLKKRAARTFAWLGMIWTFIESCVVQNKSPTLVLQAKRRCTFSSFVAGWSSSVARWAHNPEVAGSSPARATKVQCPTQLRLRGTWAFLGSRDCGIAGSGCLRSTAEFLTRNRGVALVRKHQRSALVNEQCHCRLVGAHYPGFIRSSSGAPFRHAGEFC